MLSRRNPKRTIREKQVQHGHINVGKISEMEAQAGERVGEGKKTWFKQII